MIAVKRKKSLETRHSSHRATHVLTTARKGSRLCTSATRRLSARRYIACAHNRASPFSLGFPLQTSPFQTPFWCVHLLRASWLGVRRASVSLRKPRAREKMSWIILGGDNPKEKSRATSTERGTCKNGGIFALAHWRFSWSERQACALTFGARAVARLH